MKKYLAIIIGVILSSSCSNGQVKLAENRRKFSANQITEEQTHLIYEKTKPFPYNTELSIAIIASGKVNFVGIKRIKDTIRQIENHQSIFEMGFECLGGTEVECYLP